MCIAACFVAGDLYAQATRVSATFGLQETYTNNVDLSPTPRSDFVTTITPGFGISAKGTHASLEGSISVPILLYARTGAENNSVYPNGNLVGLVELVDKFFFIEGSVTASQQFFNPFGATPTNLTSATDNRYTSVQYRISPYIQGVTGGNIDYLLRYNAYWTNLNGAPIATSSARYNEVIGTARSPVAPWGWGLDYNRTEVEFTDQRPQITQLGRLRLNYQQSSQLQLGVSGGYEDNQYPLSSSQDVIYGAQALYRPSERTSAGATWEHRFFGASYLVTFDHRTPLWAFNVRISRNITSYPQQIAALPAGGNVSSLLNNLLITRIPDPTQRQATVDQVIQDRGLPPVLTNPVNLYTQQILLQQYQNATFAILGANNSIVFTVYNSMSEPIAGSGEVLPPLLAFGNNNTQRGVDASWSHTLSSNIGLSASGGVAKTLSNTGTSFDTTYYYARLEASTKLGARTTGTVGTRYQTQRSDVGGTNYNEAAVYAGFIYAFR